MGVRRQAGRVLGALSAITLGGWLVRWGAARAHTTGIVGVLPGGDPQRLADAGVGWVVSETGSAGEFGSAASTLERLPVTYQDEQMTLHRVGGDAPGAGTAQRAVVLAAHWVWLALLLAGLAGFLPAVTRRR